MDRFVFIKLFCSGSLSKAVNFTPGVSLSRVLYLPVDLSVSKEAEEESYGGQNGFVSSEDFRNQI